MCNTVCGYRNHQTFAAIVNIKDTESHLTFWMNKAQIMYRNAESDKDFTRKINATLMLRDFAENYYTIRKDLNAKKIHNPLMQELLSISTGMLDFYQIASFVMNRFLEEKEGIK